MEQERWLPNYRVVIRNLWPYRNDPKFGFQVRMKLRTSINLAKRFQRYNYKYMP